MQVINGNVNISIANIRKKHKLMKLLHACTENIPYDVYIDYNNHYYFAQHSICFFTGNLSITAKDEEQGISVISTDYYQHRYTIESFCQIIIYHNYSYMDKHCEEIFNEIVNGNTLFSILWMKEK